MSSICDERVSHNDLAWINSWLLKSIEAHKTLQLLSVSEVESKLVTISGSHNYLFILYRDNLIAINSCFECGRSHTKTAKKIFIYKLITKVTKYKKIFGTSPIKELITF